MLDKIIENKDFKYQTFAEFKQGDQSCHIFLKNIIKNYVYAYIFRYQKLYLFLLKTILLPYLSQYGHRIHKLWFNRSFGISIKKFTKQNSSVYSLHGKIGIQINKTSKEKNKHFSSTNLSQKIAFSHLVIII